MRRPLLPETIQPHPVPIPLAPAIADAGSGEKLGSAASAPAATTSHTSFWRSRNGIITIVVVILIVIGAVVGGATGGTIKKSSNANSETNNVTPSNSGPSITVTSTTLSQQLGGHASNSDTLTIPIATMVTMTTSGPTGVTGGETGGSDGQMGVTGGEAGVTDGQMGVTGGEMGSTMGVPGEFTDGMESGPVGIPAGQGAGGGGSVVLGPARLENPGFGLASDGSGL